jgi:hypothetical protein
LGRFAQADTIVTGASNQSNGTLKEVADNQYTALTTGYYETPVLQKLNQDNAFLLAKGGLLNLSREDKQRAHIVDVPYNTQTLDRYAYCLNSPIVYDDPSGHFSMTWEQWNSIYLLRLNAIIDPWQTSANWSRGLGTTFGVALFGIGLGALCLPSALGSIACGVAGSVIGYGLGYGLGDNLVDGSTLEELISLKAVINEAFSIANTTDESGNVVYGSVDVASTQAGNQMLLIISGYGANGTLKYQKRIYVSQKAAQHIINVFLKKQ